MVGAVGEKHYELEKIRYYMFDEKVILIASGTDLSDLVKKADEIKLRVGESYEDKVRIAEVVDGEVVDYPYIRTVDEDLGLGPKEVTK